ncbi:Elongation of very long chain fatty acids protein, partial [Caligus rogercresseyi]
GKGMLMVQTCYICYLSKLLDLLDTVFFVLRKKDNQITFLHVFHHVSMPIYAWIEVRWVPGATKPLAHSSIPSYTSSCTPTTSSLLWAGHAKVPLVEEFIMVLCKSSLLVFGFVTAGIHAVVCRDGGLHVAFFILFFQFYVEAYLKKEGK